MWSMVASGGSVTVTWSYTLYRVPEVPEVG